MDYSLGFQSAIALMNNDFAEYKRIEKKIKEDRFKSIVEKKKIRTVAEYARFRRGVLKRDNHKCIRCKSVENLEVHHLKMVSVYPELAFDVNNGIALCYKCHKKEHSKGNKK